MRIKTVLAFVAVFAISIWLSVHAGEEPKPAHTEAEASAEAKARADCDTAEKAAQEAEAAVVPLRAALQKADTEYANASKAAAAKRQQATDAKNLAGEPGKRVKAGRGQHRCCHQDPGRRHRRQARRGKGVGRGQGRRGPFAGSLRCG